MDQVRRKSWASRNWGWLVGGGCLSVIIIVAVVIGAAFFKISSSIKESEPYSHAFSKAIENEKVIALLGEPIEPNGMGSSSFKYNNGTSAASLSIPIIGSKTEGEIVVEGEKINEVWSYNILYVKVEGYEETISLLSENEVLDDL